MKPYLLAAALLLAAAAPASAQIEPDVTVNPNASGSRLLLYPGGQYGRVTRELLQPGEPDPNAPIFLHMPRKHRHHAAVAKANTTPKTTVATASPKPAKQAPPPSQDTVPLSDLPDESAAKLVTSEQPPAAKPRPAPPKQAATVKPAPPKAAPPKVAAAKPAAPKQTPPPKQVASAKPPPKGLAPAPTQTDAYVVSGDQSGGSAATPPPSPAPAPAQPAPTHTASIETPPPAATTELSKRSSIVFAPGAEEPPAGALDTIKGMTSSLTAALWSGSAHIQLEAFGGKQGDKSSDARRLSLKRALIVRQLLIDDGIPSERIVVRAMGGASGGALDRVDIFVAA